MLGLKFVITKGFVTNFGIFICIKVELLALLEGLRFAKFNGYGNILVNMDSKVGVKMVSEAPKYNHPYHNVRKVI